MSHRGIIARRCQHSCPRRALTLIITGLQQRPIKCYTSELPQSGQGYWTTCKPTGSDWQYRVLRLLGRQRTPALMPMPSHLLILQRVKPGAVTDLQTGNAVREADVETRNTVTELKEEEHSILSRWTKGVVTKDLESGLLSTYLVVKSTLRLCLKSDLKTWRC